MFNQTRNRLVLFNAIVFFFLLNTLGAVMYLTTQQRLFHQVDVNLAKESDVFSTRHMDDLIHESYHLSRPFSLILWDDDGDFARQVPQSQFTDKALDHLRKNLKQSSQFTISLMGHRYRVLNKPITNGTVQFLYNIEPERKVLDNLLFTIIMVDISSIVISLVLGFILANRSLIPIRKAWEKQQQFVSDASHELRTPLTVLNVQLQRLFRHPSHTIEEESEKISLMMDETQRMSKLVADLLTLARTDTGHVEILKTNINLTELLYKVKNEFSELALIKKIQIQWNIESDMIIQADKERLHQLFVILIDNALKYTPKNGTIKVDCFKSGKHVNISVSDTGIGIPDEDLPFVFDRFYRVNKARSRSEGGTGLGLSIAKWIVDAHEGSIHAESQLDKGSTFTIHFPIE